MCVGDPCAAVCVCVGGPCAAVCVIVVLLYRSEVSGREDLLVSVLKLKPFACVFISTCNGAPGSKRLSSINYP